LNLVTIALRNSWRNRLRTLLTLCGVAIAMLTYLILSTASSAWTSSVGKMAEDRLVTRNSISFVLPLPRRYADDVRAVPGVEAATGITWFAGVLPSRGSRGLASLAIDAHTFFDVYPEITVSDADRRRFLSRPDAAMVGVELADDLNFRVGDRVVLESGAFPGSWEFVVAATYRSSRESEGQETFYLRSDYLNSRVQGTQGEQVGWVSSRVLDPSTISRVAHAIDAVHEDHGLPTTTTSVRTLNSALAGLASSLMTALQVTSAAILLIMILILGNAQAMSVRERTQEYGTLRALGFRPAQLLLLIVLESAAMGAVGGGAGIILAIPVIDLKVAAILREVAPGTFPYFALTARDASLAFATAPFLAGLAAGVPGLRACRLDIAAALRATA
jgi:putative ABC transport system permease protein